MGMITGGPEYDKAVDEELTGFTESMQRCHHGDVRYLAWLERVNPAQHEILAGMATQIALARGMLPFPLLKEIIGLYLAMHKVFFAAWECQSQTGLEVLARLTSSTGWKM
jgi:hypothetical protein